MQLRKPKALRRSRLYFALAGFVAVGLLIAFWFLPIRGKIIILTDSAQGLGGVWPQVKLDPLVSRPGDKVIFSLSDTVRREDVKLYIDAKEAGLVGTTQDESRQLWSWQWQFVVPARPNYTAIFYYACQSGCIEGGRFELGARSTSQPAAASLLMPTKLGLVFADEARDWHGRAGWNVDLLYLRQPANSDFGLDVVAGRVAQAQQQGLRVLLRLAYDRGQALPPAGDETALRSYLEYCARLARDARFKGVYGFIIGSGFNRKSENALAPDQLVTPEWYARLFNGYGLPPARTDNVLQTFRLINPQARVLVGPVTPWSADQSGAIKDPTDVPWLHYMNTLVAHLDESDRFKQASGFAMLAPDGFAVQASGRPEAPEIADRPDLEPANDIFQAQWGRAQAGFRVYRDWIRDINRYASTRNLPVYITSTNTFTSDTEIDPEQNYPSGWLTTALNEINREPQVQALCWFVDHPYDKWAAFSLKLQPGSLKDAALEFDRLLQQ
jgi:hypothetical protein